MKQALAKYWKVIVAVGAAILGLLFLFQVRRDSKVEASTTDSKSVIDIGVDAHAKLGDAVVESVKSTNIVMETKPVPVDPNADLAKLVDTYNKL